MKGFRKSDEMEMSINMKAVRLAWAYSSIFLLVWIMYDWLMGSTFNGLAFILLSSQLAVYWGVQIVLKWKMGKNEK